MSRSVRHNQQEQVRGVLIDIAGVLYVGDKPVPGAGEALGRLGDAALPIRFLTNTTRKTRAMLMEQLGKMGFDVPVEQLFTAPLAARRLLEIDRLRPHLLVHPDLAPEYDGLDRSNPNAVVVGDAGDAFTYQALNEAFGILMQQTSSSPDGRNRLIAMGDNRYFRDGAQLSLDMGPFVRALERAAEVTAEVVGKPSAAFFQTALHDMGCPATRTVMIGDDLENDIGGAQGVGCRGILVRTGKFRTGDETHRLIHPDAVADHLPAAIDTVLSWAKGSRGQ